MGGRIIDVKSTLAYIAIRQYSWYIALARLRIDCVLLAYFFFCCYMWWTLVIYCCHYALSASVLCWNIFLLPMHFTSSMEVKFVFLLTLTRMYEVSLSYSHENGPLRSNTSVSSYHHAKMRGVNQAIFGIIRNPMSNSITRWNVTNFNGPICAIPL